MFANFWLCLNLKFGFGRCCSWSFKEIEEVLEFGRKSPNSRSGKLWVVEELIDFNVVNKPVSGSLTNLRL